MKYLFFVLTPLFLLGSCSDNMTETGVCYSFDLKSCAGDPWNKSGDASPDQVEKATKYLRSQDINPISMKIEGYHEIVCLACEVCPAGPRFYLKVKEADVPKLKKLNLLSLEPSTLCK